MKQKTDAELLSSISLVAGAVSLKQTPVRKAATIHSAEKMISAIEIISRLVAAIDRKKVEPDQTKLFKAVFDLGYLLYKRLPSVDIGIKDDAPSILSAIRRNSDENLHSDLIAALLRPSIMGEFAYEFFDELVNQVELNEKHDRGEPKFQIAAREVRLDYINQKLVGTPLGDRRIDILVETVKYILIIENKIYSSESDNQTFDYYDAVSKRRKDKKIIGVLLSPYGTAPQCDSFKCMSYFQFNVIVEKLYMKLPENSDYKAFCRFYLNELRKTILLPNLSRLLTLQNYYKGVKDVEPKKVQ